MTSDDIYNYGLMLAIKIEVDGMIADNTERVIRNEAIAWSEADFQRKADEVRNITKSEQRMIKLFQEDDCAPGALEYFEKRLLNECNLTINEIKKQGEYSEPNDLTMKWEYLGIVLEFCADDPFYSVYKKE